MNTIVRFVREERSIGPSIVRAKIGAVTVGWYGYNSLRSRTSDDTEKFRWVCDLPGLRSKAKSGTCENELACENQLRIVAAMWFTMLDMEKKS